MVTVINKINANSNVLMNICVSIFLNTCYTNFLQFLKETRRSRKVNFGYIEAETSLKNSKDFYKNFIFIDQFV